MNVLEVSTSQLRRALDIKEQIEELQQELQTILNRGGTTGARRGAARGRRRMSAAAKARIAAAQRARWARQRAGGTRANGANLATAKRRVTRRMSPAARARIAAAQRARWARFRSTQNA